MRSTEQQKTIPIACIPDAIPPEEREGWVEVGRRVYGAVDEVQELEHGYAFRLPADVETLVALAESVARERLCCPFIHWRIEIEPAAQHAWLHMTGRDGTKAFTRAAFEETALLRPDVAKAAGFRPASTAPLTSARVAEMVPELNARFDDDPATG